MVPVAGPLAAQWGATDCEALGSGLLVQPSNAVSSLAFVVVGLAVAMAAGRLDGEARSRSYLFAALVAAVGVGSVAFHGPQPYGARLLHDVPVVVALLFVVLHDLDLLRPRPGRFDRGLAGGTVAGVVLATGLPDVMAALAGLAAVAAVAAEAAVHRRGVRPVPRRAQRRAHAAIVATMAVGSTWFWLGRTDSGACDPAAFVQWHGLWHVAGTLAFGTWWWLAFAAPRYEAVGSASAARRRRRMASSAKA